jgi:hypothetical protein
MTNEQIIKEFRETKEAKFIKELISKSDYEWLESFILQVRTDTIDEIRKEVESKKKECQLRGKQDYEKVESYNQALEYIKTFLNNINI